MSLNLTKLSPNSGPSNGGTTITIFGTTVTGVTTVKFGTIPATTIVTSPTKITCKTPSHAIGRVGVSIKKGVTTVAKSTVFSFTSTSVFKYPIVGVTVALTDPFSTLPETVTIAKFVQLITTDMGRQHELQQIEAQTIKLSLTNRKGPFSPWNRNSPYVNRLTLLDSTITQGTNGSWHALTGSMIVSGNGIDGGPCLLIQGSSSTGYNYVTAKLTPINLGVVVTPLKHYSAFASFKAVSGTTTCRVSIEWYTSAGAAISPSTSSIVVANTGGWKKVSLMGAQAPSNAAYALLQIVVSGPTRVTRFGFTKRYVDDAVNTTHFVDNSVWGPGGFGITAGRPIKVTGTWTTVSHDVAYAYLTTTIPVIPDVMNKTETISASDFLKLIANQTINSSFYPGTVVLKTPVLYWRLGEALRNKIANDYTLNGNLGIVSSGVTLSNTGGLANDLNTSAHFGPPHPVITETIATKTANFTLTTAGATIELWYKGVRGGTTSIATLYLTNHTTGKTFGIKIFTTAAYISVPTGQVEGTGFTLNNGVWRHIVLVINATTAKIYVDGVLKATRSSTTIVSAVGTYTFAITSSNATCFMQDVAVYPSILSLTTITLHHKIGTTTPFYMTASGTAIKLLLLGAQIPLSAMSLKTGLAMVNLSGTTTAGTSSLSSTIQQITGTEQGVFFQDVSGILQFYTRNYVISATAATKSNGTFSNATTAPMPYQPGVQPAKDDLTLWNTVPVKSVTAATAYRASTQGSIVHFQRRVLQGYTGTLFQNAVTTVALAQLLLSLYRFPYTRVREITVLSTSATGRTVLQQLARRLIDLIGVTYAANDAGTIFSQKSQIEKISHSIVPGVVWQTTWVLTPYNYSTFSGTFSGTGNGTGPTKYLIFDTTHGNGILGGPGSTAVNRFAF